MVLITMKVTVKLDGDYLVFVDSNGEFYDISIKQYFDYLPALKVKNWWTNSLENDCKALIDGRG